MPPGSALRIASHHPVFRRHPELDAHGESVRAWLSETGPARTYRPKSELDEETGPPPCFVATGWVGRLAEAGGQRRQVIDILLPGDAIGFDGLATCERSRLVALSGVQVQLAPQKILDGAAGDALTAALATARTREQQRHINHIVRLGSHTPEERLCDLFLELTERLAQVGLTDERRLPMPLSQQVLADLLGVSAVHVNRTLRALRLAALIDIKGGAVILHVPAIEARFPHLRR